MAWVAAQSDSGLFDSSSPAARWSAATWRKTASGYGRYLAWLDEHDQLDPAAPIAERVNRKLLNRYLSDLEAVNRGHTIHSRIQELSDALRILVPSVDFGWIRRGAGRLRSATVPATNKLARMRPIETLVKESFGLMDWAEQAPGLSNLRRALLFRDALMVAFLCFHPIRLRNVSGLRLGRQLIEQGDRLVLALPTEETKTRNPFEAPIQPVLALRLRRYLAVHRRVLLERGAKASIATDALWLSANGEALKDGPLSVRIAKMTGRNGPSLRPHHIRSCAGTDVARRVPGEVHLIAAVLGHSGPAIGERFYNLAGSLEASRAQSNLISSLRGQRRFGSRQ